MILLNLLNFLGQHATLILAGGVLAGLALPQLAELARPLLIPGLVIPLTIALIRLDWSAFQTYSRRPLLVILLISWILVFSPILMAGITAFLPISSELRAALVLMAGSAPIVSSAALALILRLDAALTVIVVIATTAIVPFSLPPVARFLLDWEINIGVYDLMGRLVLLVGGAFFLALAARRLLSREWIATRARMFDGISVCVLLIFALAIMAGKTEVLLTRPIFFFTVIAIAFLANLGLQLVGALIFRPLGTHRCLSTSLISGNRNMGLILVALGTDADFDVEVFFALAQIPMYVLPALLKPLYRRALPAEISTAKYHR